MTGEQAATKPTKHSIGARTVAQLVDQIGDPAVHLPAPVREHVFHPVRKWRFDLAWPELLVALEVDGGVYIGGAHNRGPHVESDCEKFSSAAALGWRVLRVTPRHVRDGRALLWLVAALEYGGGLERPRSEQLELSRQCPRCCCGRVPPERPCARCGGSGRVID